MWGVPEMRHQPGFTSKALDELRIGGELGADDLQRDAGVEVVMRGEIDLAHAAPPQRPDDSVRSHRLPGVQGEPSPPAPVRNPIVLPPPKESFMVLPRSGATRVRFAQSRRNGDGAW